MTRVMVNQILDGYENKNTECNSEEEMDFQFERYHFRETTRTSTKNKEEI